MRPERSREASSLTQISWTRSNAVSTRLGRVLPLSGNSLARSNFYPSWVIEKGKGTPG
jgi:hypothetical protein